MRSIEVLFSPAEFEALNAERLKDATCVVFDILRATTSITTALANGAEAVIPVGTIEEAVAQWEADSTVLLAGEREGYRITAELTGNIDFKLGNSPREFTRPAVEGRRIVMTTTNGTRALKACRGAVEVLAASFLNLGATVAHLQAGKVKDLLVVCSGTHEEAAVEDTLAAGALVRAVWPMVSRGHIADSAQIARLFYQPFAQDLLNGVSYARNGRRLLGIPELRDDVPFCLQSDIYPVVARLETSGQVVALNSAPGESAARGR